MTVRVSEQVKNVLLALLVLLSLFLSWQLWTYQPRYDYLPPAKFDEPEGLADRREFHELIKPHMIVHHLGEEQYTVSYPDTFSYNVIQRKMKEWELQPIRLLERERYADWQELFYQEQGIELVFWNGIPLQVLGGMFKVNLEEWLDHMDQNQLPRINRVWLHHDPHLENEVSVLFFSEEDQLLLRSRTSNISIRDLGDYIALGKTGPVHEAYVVKEEDQPVHTVHYLSADPVSVAERVYHYQRIPVYHMVSYLFVDPTLVRRIEERGDSILYIHGPRGLQVNKAYTQMTYFHPPLEAETRGVSSSVVDVGRGIQFVNQHKGWDKPYVFDSITEMHSERLVQVYFREYVEHYPVFGLEQEDTLYTLRVDIQMDRVVGYVRSLLERGEAANQRQLQLPSGVELLTALEAQGIDLAEISTIRIGYKSEQDTMFLTYEPYWVVDFKQGKRWFIQNVQDVRRHLE
ncbi:regulatory protein YycH of two-component signal transduction system YycFG [Caldalkalibacillus uzonensis]|uniref:Regulatory protein YycH of two-component signal transduction system YycFG n=1 Tax=Caldalkalibacillus uzonensis TaxID=353224 RepID=A0ABU0CSA9_9BACI|nr:two-component system activity regulator YycH [Caldalkalibacillus uzonensis]MDQ0339308.1 regulatory protein YycH of two-component signal transduction system YycFG [Caldalkalibacillus uzonensis]